MIIEEQKRALMGSFLFRELIYILRLTRDVSGAATSSMAC